MRNGNTWVVAEKRATCKLSLAERSVTSGCNARFAGSMDILPSENVSEI